jgi:hypothetical protein
MPCSPGRSNQRGAPEEADEQIPEVLPADEEGPRNRQGKVWGSTDPERSRRAEQRGQDATRIRLTCPYCSSRIRAEDLRCQRCQASLKDADLLEEEEDLSRRLQRRRRWAFVFGVPGIFLLVAGSIILSHFFIQEIEQPFWAALPLVVGIVFIVIGVGIEGASRSGTSGEIAVIYGVAGLVARAVFGDTLERFARVRAILQERGLLPRKKRRR